ncbi:MAG: hypothetical protein A2X64_09435 [Ignavibacteria bacterium GWF2_33_9]|nr:MAG: hypothetical protein A2X64_09435 [Ignavibacteria bacterium GWF2_33_9]
MRKFQFLLSLAFILFAYQDTFSSETNIDEIKNKLPKLLGASNSGTEFVIGFHPCWEESGQTNLVRIYVSSSVETEVRLTIPALSSEPYAVKKTLPHNVIEFTLTPEEAQPYRRGSGGARSSLKPTQVWPGRGIIIESDDPIVVYGMVRYLYTSDGFLALPVNALGKEYVISSYTETANFTTQSLTPYADIIGVFDSTKVTLMIGGSVSTTVRTLDEKIWKPHEVLHADLNRGDFWLIASEGEFSDLGGCRVIADKPISVISGSHCSYVPWNNSACDFLIEQEIPTISWGQKYYVTPIVDRKFASIIRIFGNDDSTNYYRNGGLLGSLNGNFGVEGESWVELRAHPDSNLGVTFTSDKPIQITQYNTGMSEDGVASDPFQMTLLPESLFQNELIFNTPGIRGGYGFKRNFVNIIYKSTTNEIPDDLEFGEVLSSDSTNWKKVKEISPAMGQNLNDPDYLGTDSAVYAKILIIPYDGVYRLRCASQKIMAYAYGHGSWESYGMPVSGYFVEQDREDIIPPEPVITEIPGTDNLQTDLQVVHGYVVDIDNNKDGNLGIIVFNKAYSYNTGVKFDRFIHGETKRVDFTVSQIDTTKEGLAVITFGDRAGNDSTIFIEFAAKYFKRIIGVTSPITDTQVMQGEFLTIKWESNFDEDVTIELYQTDNLLLTISEEETNDGESSYQIPYDVSEGTDYRVKVSSTMIPEAFAFSDYFEITKTDIKKTLTLLQPDIKSILQRGETLNISWMESIPFSVKVDLYLDGELKMNLADNLFPLKYDWQIPIDIQLSDKYRIRISDAADSNLFIETDYINIQPDDAAKILTFVSPNSSTVAKFGSVLYINWDCNFIYNVNLDLYLKDTIIKSIKTNIENSGYIVWNIPFGIEESKEYFVKISEFNKPNVTFRSENFQLYNPVSVDEKIDITKENIVISPNPVRTSFNAEISDGTIIQSITVFDILGEKKISVNNLNDSNIKLDVSNLPNGKYILEIQTERGTLTSQFVILK